MISNCILIFQNNEQDQADDLLSYSGDHDFTTLTSLEAKVDTRDFTLSFLGDTFPNIKKLRLNNSIIPSIRDIGCTLVSLRFLSLARCNISSLDGIATISQNLEELYLAFNNITDVCDLMGMEKLVIVDLEDNKITQLDNIEVLTLCTGLRALTMAGNPAAQEPNYREKVKKLLPQLVYLDEKRLNPKVNKKATIPKEKSNKTTINNTELKAKNDKNSDQTSENTIISMAPVEILENDTKNSNLDTSSAPKIIQSFSKTEKSVTFADLPPPSVIPLDFSEGSLPEHSHGDIMTEMVTDLVEERPPTSHGFYGTFKEFGRSSSGPTNNNNSQKKTKNVFASSGPRIVRPMSAKGRPF